MNASALSVSSSPGLRRGIVVAIATAACIGYFIALHLMIVSHAAPRVALAMVLLPWIVAALSRRGWRPWGGLLLVAAGVAFFSFADALALRVDKLLLVENLVFLLSLAAVFAFTLRPGHVALVSALARKVRGGDLPAAAVRYTRLVTAAWSVFFVACACMSLALHAWAPLSWWSLFVNVLVWPSIAAMFALEYAVRVRVLPHLDHVPLAASFRAYADRNDADVPSDDRTPR